MSKPMIMGRKTFESFPNPLPGRRHIVLTRDAAWRAEGAQVAHSAEAALALAGNGDVAVIGGAEVNALFLPLARRVELTEVRAAFEGDTFMPELDARWRETFRKEHPAEGGRPAFAFVTLVRDLLPGAQ
jgi:dihydrofolate reductase